MSIAHRDVLLRVLDVVKVDEAVVHLVALLGLDHVLRQ